MLAVKTPKVHFISKVLFLTPQDPSVVSDTNEQLFLKILSSLSLHHVIGSIRKCTQEEVVFEQRYERSKSHARARRRPFQAEGTALGWEQTWHVHNEERRPRWLEQSKQQQEWKKRQRSSHVEP